MNEPITIPDEVVWVVADMFRRELSGDSRVELPAMLEAAAHQRSTRFARAALEAVVPGLLREQRAAERERIAQAIEIQMRPHDRRGFSAVGDAYSHSARIARGES